MADRGGGRGGSRGRGHSGDRGGGRGRGQPGDRGGGRGRGHPGDRGGGRGGDRGGFDGQGRGRGSATFSGIQGRGDGSRGGGRGQGDGRGRGRGDFGPGRGRGRGGPGGFGGGRPDKFAGEAPVFSDGPRPEPDKAVMALENRLIGQQVKSAAVGKSAQTETPPGAQATLGRVLPRRPAFGNQGKQVILWANYFTINISANAPLLKYTLKVERVGKEPGDKEGSKPEGTQKPENKEPKGKKLHTIVKSALDQVAKSVPYATEFKDQVITRQKLPLTNEQTVKVKYTIENRDDEYNVRFSGPITVDLPGLLRYVGGEEDPTADTSYPKFPEQIDALSIITGHFARSGSDSAALGSSRYFPLHIEGERFELEQPDFNRIVRGYFQSARLATGRLLLNTNVSHGVFRPHGKVSALIDKFRDDYGSLHRLLLNLRARIEILSQDKDLKKTRIVEKTICGLAEPAKGKPKGKGKDEDQNKPPIIKGLGAKAKDVQFYIRAPAPAGIKPNAYCSVEEYYRKKYGFTVDPRYPVVNVGSRNNPVYMPAELVTILDGQPLRRKLTPNETRDMINFSCRSPFANATSISTFGRQVLGLDTSEILRHFGVQIGKSLLTVHGRVLSPPAIVYKDKKKVNVREGEWNMEKVKVVKPGQRIDRWFWILIDTWNIANERLNEVEAGVKGWVDFMRLDQGIDIAENDLTCEHKVVVDRYSPAGAIREKFQEMKRHKPQFVFVVLPGRKTDSLIYNEVKKLGDREFGYASQNVLQQNLLKNKNNLQLWANLGLKVNMKMGGTNHKLDNEIPIVKQGDTMVVGYDVTHPTNLAGNTKNLPSLVGMVASIDKELGQWPGVAWKQAGRVEMLDETLTAHFKERIKLFEKHNGRKPRNIIIFRDGVSEGQFEQVIKIELPRIRAACENLYDAQTRPKLALIVSVKRHQTRFYPTNPNDQLRSRNIMNGTVVDRGVTQATTWDFFLTAHKGLQGTSRPAHYTVLHDEIFRSPNAQTSDAADVAAANQLEKLTFEMCHLFGRATKAVSICPPAYYADILCTRARVYLSDMFEGSDTQSVTSATSSNLGTGPIDVHENLKDSMFYI